MIYATVCPEKFEGDKGVKLMQVGGILCIYCLFLATFKVSDPKA